MNNLFASYVTGSAFRLDLSRRMVTSLMSAAEGKSLNTGHWGVSGLIERGIMEVTEDQEKSFYKDVRLTDVGKKVVELCVMAGLEAK